LYASLDLRYICNGILLFNVAICGLVGLETACLPNHQPKVARQVVGRRTQLPRCVLQVLKHALSSETLRPRSPVPHLLQLPADLPAECPFPFTWHACGVVVTCSDPAHLAALKEALAKLQGQQQLAVADLVAKLDPASPLAQEVSAAQAAAGGTDVSR
jgi:hypothetical protein